MRKSLQARINLSFRHAFKLFKQTESGEQSFGAVLLDLRRRYQDQWTHEAQWYWDVLWQVNMRGKSLEQLIQEEATKDPEKEAWIKQQIEGGILSGSTFFDMGKNL